MSLIESMRIFKQMQLDTASINAAKVPEPAPDPVIVDQGFDTHVIHFATNVAFVPKNLVKNDTFPGWILDSANSLPNEIAYFKA
jgi:hypothetical protein